MQFLWVPYVFFARAHSMLKPALLLIYSGPPLYIIMTNKAINNHLSFDALYNNVHNEELYILVISKIAHLICYAILMGPIRFFCPGP